MPTITVLRGFKVPVPVLDAFLTAHEVTETEGIPPRDNADRVISTLFRNKMGAGAGDARLFIPQREGYSRSTLAYVAYSWLHVYVQRRIIEDDDLLKIAPASFVKLRDDIMGFAHGASGFAKTDPSMGDIGLYVVFTASLVWVPQILYDRIEVIDSPNLRDRSGFDHENSLQSAVVNAN
jgi:hypothetical protein